MGIETPLENEIRSLRFLAGVGHLRRTIIFMLGLIVFYCLWLWLLVSIGLLESSTPDTLAAVLLLAPLPPAAVFDFWLRIGWKPDFPTLYPPPPTPMQRLLAREYGLYWFPVLICIPLWMWIAGLIGWVILGTR